MKLARLAALLLLLALLGALGASLAFADAETAEAPPELAIQWDEGDEEGEWEDECVETEEAEEGSEETEECEEEAEKTSFSPAEDCYLRTAQARVVAYPSRNQMRLTLGYTTYEPVRATVEYSAKSNHRLGVVTRNLGRSGVVRLSKHLGEKEMDQLQGARHFTVAVHVAEAPKECSRLETERLEVERHGDSRITWSEDR